MDFRIICRQNDYYDISGDIRELIEGRRWNSLIMQKGSGKTTLLSMLYYYFDIDENSYDLFKDSMISRTWNQWEDYLNKRVVLVMDYNDFAATDMVSALKYIRSKMLSLYKEKQHLVLHSDDREIEHYMSCLMEIESYDPSDIDEKNHKGKNYLADSLRNLLWFFYHHAEYSMERPVLLIDNMCFLEKMARMYGYYPEMNSFLRNFLSIEPEMNSFCLRSI